MEEISQFSTTNESREDGGKKFSDETIKDGKEIERDIAAFFERKKIELKGIPLKWAVVEFVLKLFKEGRIKPKVYDYLFEKMKDPYLFARVQDAAIMQDKGMGTYEEFLEQNSLYAL